MTAASAARRSIERLTAYDHTSQSATVNCARAHWRALLKG